MDDLMTVEELIAFEADIAAIYNTGVIKAPVHLSGGNEQQLIDIFRDVEPHDWVCSTWRSHYHCLLKGVAPETVKADILAGRSITLNYPSHRILTSAIVGGVIPIALGVALALKRRQSSSRVWCFMGDMTHRTGIFFEALQYAGGHGLPIKFVVENNGKSVGTITQDVWGSRVIPQGLITEYSYDLCWPHSGAGQWVNF